MKKLFLTLLLIPILSWANPIDTQCPQFVLRGAPISVVPDNSGQYLCKTNYAIHYNYATKTPEYVVEHVTKASVSGPAKRKDNFRPDPAIPKQYSAELLDYESAGQIYDRGHMAPAGDNTQNDQIMSESFFLSNMVPQVANNNRGIWKQLEEAVRGWANEGKDIYVSSGTIYAPGYQTIGQGRVAVPTHIWKVVIDRTNNRAIAFIFPNAALPVSDLPKYATTISNVEKATSIRFMPQLPPPLVSIKSTPPNLSQWSGLH